MREIDSRVITETVKCLCIDANCHLPEDMRQCITRSCAEENWPQAKEILERIIENYEIAHRDNLPVCQDTGDSCLISGTVYAARDAAHCLANVLKIRNYRL